MKKNLSRCLVLFLGFNLVLGIFSGCADKDGSEDTVTSEESSEEVSGAESSEAEPSEESSKAESSEESSAAEPSEGPSEEPSEEPSAAESSDKPSEEPDTPYEPTKEEIASYTDTWIHLNYTDETVQTNRLMLSPDGTTQLVVQDMVGQLLDLTHGTWAVVGKGLLKIDLIREEASDSQQKQFGGLYSISLGESDSMQLTAEDGADMLMKDQNDKPSTFCKESAVTEYGALIFEERLCKAVKFGYETEEGKAYSGKAKVTDKSSKGWEVTLSDGGKTDKSYLLDPNTFKGTDSADGKAVDFLPYAK